MEGHCPAGYGMLFSQMNCCTVHAGTALEALSPVRQKPVITGNLLPQKMVFSKKLPESHSGFFFEPVSHIHDTHTFEKTGLNPDLQRVLFFLNLSLDLAME